MAKRNQGQDGFEDMHFPLAGIDLSMGYDRQQPRPVLGGTYSRTTPIGQNVRAFDALQSRARGGSRPMLSRYISRQVQGPNLIQDLNVVVGVGYTPPGPSGGNPVVVQTGAGAAGGAGATTLTDTFAFPVTAGNAVILAIGGANFHFPSSLSDGINNYSTAVQNSVNNACAGIYYCLNVVGGFTTVTANWAGLYGNGIVAFEVAGLTGATDGTEQGGGHNTSGSISPITTTNANNFVLACMQGSNTITGWPAWATNNQSGGDFVANYQVTSATGTFGPSYTFVGLNWFQGVIAAFKGS